MKSKLPLYLAAGVLGIAVLSYLFFSTIIGTGGVSSEISHPETIEGQKEAGDDKSFPGAGSSENAPPGGSREQHNLPPETVFQGAQPDSGYDGRPPKLTMQEVIEHLNTNERVEMTEKELNAVILHSLTEVFPGNSNHLVKNLESQIQRGKVVVGMVIDINYIPWEYIPREYHYTRQYVEQYAALSGGELDIQVSGKPLLKDHQLEFDDQSTIQIGFIKYSLNNLIARLDQNKDFNKQLFRKPLPFREISLEEGMLILSK